jgi:hypothetical protein
MHDPKEQISVNTESAAPADAFLGFAPPVSNTTYTPNQFFDVCVPHCSRGCVRLVAYMIRRTLGWCDADGNPQEDQIIVSYNDLITGAGISRGAVGEAIEEAIAANFIRCVRKGRPKAARQTAVTALYELRWDPAHEYVKDPKRFQGFFEGEGNRTDIPNEYFDVVVRSESLAVIKVVGAVIRFSIGFQANRGARRQQVQLSFSDIQRYAHIAARRHLSGALQHALEQNYIVRVQAGLFTPDKELQSTATYAVKWLDKKPYPYIGSIKTPEPSPLIGSKRTPENRFKKDTSIKTKLTNETFNKQQQPAEGVLVAAVTEISSYQILKEQGFSERDATALAAAYPAESIVDQVGWLALRNPSRNRLGMLRKAIEENWPAPDSGSGQVDFENGKVFAAHFYAGYAGNDQDPVTSPTLGDAQDAQTFVAKLLESWPEEHRIPAWGRALGKLFIQRAAANKNVFVSCRLALRMCGDDFYARIRAERKSRQDEAMQQARTEHKRRFGRVYRDFILSEEKRVKEENLDAYAVFEQTRLADREQILKSPFCFSEEFRAEQLRQFDTESQRLRDFAKHFELINFWQWDREHNPERFQEGSHALCE